MIIEVEARDDRLVSGPDGTRSRCSRAWRFFEVDNEILPLAHAEALQRARSVWPNATSLKVVDFNDKSRAPRSC